MKARTARRYQERLRTIGARLDAGGYHSVTILEVDGGMVVRASAPGKRAPEVLEIVDGDSPPAFSAPPSQNRVPHRLFSRGYAPFLAALGECLDRSQVAAIAIVEGTDFLTVAGIRPVAETGDQATYEPLDILLLAEDIEVVTRQAGGKSLGGRLFRAPDTNEPAETAERGNTGLLRRVTGTLDSALRIAHVPQYLERGRG